MTGIEFSKPEKALLVKKIQRYFSEELDQELGAFDAEFLLDFFAKEMGVYSYNQGIDDARLALEQKIEEISEVIDEIKKPVEYRR